MKKIIISALAIAVVVSCSKRELESGLYDKQRIVFGSSIEASTKRAADATSFDEGEKIYVYAYRLDAPGTTVDFSTPFLDKVEFTCDAAGIFSCTSTDAIWKVGKAHNFYAIPVARDVTRGDNGITTTPIKVAAVTGIAAADDVIVAKTEMLLYDEIKTTANLKFTHMLSRVQFKIRKNAGDPMAILTSLDFKMASNECVINIAGNVIKTAGSVPLGKDFSAAPIEVTDLVELGDWMVISGDVLSDIMLTINGVKMNIVGATNTVTTQAGKVTIITVTVNQGKITFTSKIEPWVVRSSDAGETDEVINPILEHGQKPYNEVGAIPTPTATSYNTLQGEGDTNGTRYTSEAAAYSGEKPYRKFEIAHRDAYNGGTKNKDWRALQGTTLSDNICVMTHGAGWRLPRLSELQLIYLNRAALNASGKGFIALGTSRYSSATEYNSADAWYIDFGNTIVSNASKASTVDGSVRCIKEIP